MIGHDLCMTHGSDGAGPVLLQKCDPCDLNQRWSWEQYTPKYDAMFLSDSGGEYSKVDTSNELAKLKEQWPAATLAHVDQNNTGRAEWTLC